MTQTVVVGMSGGVDSSVACALLVEQGYEVIGVTLRTWEDDREEEKSLFDRSCCKVGLARYVAETLSIPHQVIDVREEFREAVIEDFIAQYSEGKTPNPCVRCNERIKFGCLSRVAEERGGVLATGHYARVEYDPERKRHLLKKGGDPVKDQSYFLYRLTQGHLARSLFPVGGMRKREVWQKARELDLPYEEVLESQEVCFVTQKDYREFLSQARPEAVSQGHIVTEDGEVIGEHRGVAFYTVGQRKGLGVSVGERAYVLRCDAETNQVVVGREESLYQGTLIAEAVNCVSCERVEGRREVTAKIRYRTPEAAASIEPWEGGRIKVRFHTPQRAIAPGQSIVFYEGEYLLGGGIISQTTDALL